MTVFMITATVWAIGISRHRFLPSEFWLYLAIFLVPAALVCGSVWLILIRRTWVRVLGVVLALPSLAMWAVSLMLVCGGFRIH
jgi:hypothetical protein